MPAGLASVDTPRTEFCDWPLQGRQLWILVTFPGLAASALVIAYSLVTCARDLRVLPTALLWILVGSLVGAGTRAILPPLGPTAAAAGSLVFAVVLLFPIHWAILSAVVITVASHHGATWRARTYELSCTTLAVTMAGWIWSLAGSGSYPRDIRNFLFILAAGFTYFTMSRGLLVLLATLTFSPAPDDATESWRSAHAWSVARAFSTGICFAVVWVTSPWVLAPILLLTLSESQMLRRMFAAATDVRQARQETAVERERSRIDALTGLSNRGTLDQEVRYLQRADGVLMLDLDHFKLVNDTYGHGVGDRVLKAVAKAMQQAVRPTDFCSRYGGEELCALLPGMHRRGDLYRAGERIRESVAEICFADLPALKVTASIGVSAIGSDGAAEAFKRADLALYRAKHGGRNQVQVLAYEDMSGPDLTHAA